MKSACAQRPPLRTRNERMRDATKLTCPNEPGGALNRRCFPLLSYART
jgi:hypothetical protein